MPVIRNLIFAFYVLIATFYTFGCGSVASWNQVHNVDLSPIPTNINASSTSSVTIPSTMPAPLQLTNPALQSPEPPVTSARSPYTNPLELAPARDIELGLLGGGSLSLSNLTGEVVVLNFWASWCPPCRQEMPSFQVISEEFKDQGVVVLGIAVSDTREAASQFAESAGVTYPLALDHTGAITRAYRVTNMPTTFIINRVGVVARRINNIANEGVLRIFIRGQL